MGLKSCPATGLTVGNCTGPGVVTGCVLNLMKPFTLAGMAVDVTCNLLNLLATGAGAGAGAGVVDEMKSELSSKDLGALGVVGCEAGGLREDRD